MLAQEDEITMIQFEFSRVDAGIVGADHGLALSQEWSRHGERMQALVSQLYASRKEDGAWTKWLNLGYNQKLAEEINEFARTCKGKYDDLVILGIGGSSLGGYALLKALCHPYWNLLSSEKRDGYPRYHFVENVDADQIDGLMAVLNLKRTQVLVISKSGTTAETMSAFLLLKQQLDAALGTEQAARQIVAITDEEAGILRPLAEKEGYTTFEVPDDVGGRFSVFSAVGLLPAALCGVDIDEILEGVRDIDGVLQNPNLAENPVAQSSLIHYLLNEKGKTMSVFMPYSNALSSVSDWYVQLWAESLGKEKDLNGNLVYAGQTPVRAVGVTDQHSQVQLFNEGPNNKVITFVEVQKCHTTVTIPKGVDGIEALDYLVGKTFNELMAAEFEATRASLTKRNRPNLTISLPAVTPYYFGQLLYCLQVQTALTGMLMNIDPFDQPGVEWAKKATKALMGQPDLAALAAEVRGTPQPV